MIRIVAEPRDLSNIELTLSLTMSVAEWQQVHDQLIAKHPSWEVASRIAEVMRKLTAQVHDRIEVKG